MKRLCEQINLQGVFEEISMTEFRARPGEVIQSVELGKTFLVKRNGLPIAVVCPVPSNLTTVVNPDGTVSYTI